MARLNPVGSIWVDDIFFGPTHVGLKAGLAHFPKGCTVRLWGLFSLDTTQVSRNTNTDQRGAVGWNGLLGEVASTPTTSVKEKV